MRLLRPALGIGVGTLVLAAGIGTATAGDPAQPRVRLDPATVTSAAAGQPPTAATVGAGGPSDPSAVRPYMLEIDGRPAAVAAELTRRSTGSQAQAARSGRQQRAANVSTQAAAMQVAERRGLVRRELFRVRTAYNGVAVMARGSDVDRLRRIAGVRDVVPLPLHERRNDRSVPAVGAPQVWKAAAGGNVGKGIRVGVVDTGIDYVHATFGGSADPDDLAAARSAASNPEASGPVPGFEVTNGTGDVLYPNAVVVGGVDFVGDDYDGQSTPRPDPNPMDCPLELGGGHGSHVAGSLGGRGVNADGSTYAGDYDDVPSDLKLGPGVAPGVELYSIRIFGCDGSTAFIAKGIDWAVDPNQDGDPSDHLDVLNISAGSDFGDPDAPDVQAAQTASQLGVAVVIAAGNSGNRTHILGAPAVAPAALTVANMSTGDWRDALDVDAPGTDADGTQLAQYSSAYPWSEMPSDIGGELVRAPEANAYGCEPFATPMTGRVVLVEGRSAPGAEPPCTSAERAEHAQAAGAVGLVLADVETELGTPMWGVTDLPLAHVAADVRTRLLDALTSETPPTVTFKRELAASTYDLTTADTVDETTSRGPGAAGGIKPEIAAPGQSIISARSGSGSGTVSMGGTSMAAPHAAGAMALLRNHRRSWSVEELKAALVNTARPEVTTARGHAGRRESPARVGAGALDVPAALATTTVAYAANADGAVAVGFGPLQVPVGGKFQAERTVRVANKGTASATYQVRFESITAVPGVAWELPDGDTVTVAPGRTAELRVRLVVADPSQLRHVHDDTQADTFDDEGTLLRQRLLAEASGLLRLASAERTLSVPVHAAVRPAAATTGPARVDLAPGATTGALAFSGSAFDSGRTPTDFLATRIALEWHGSSPRKDAADDDRVPAHGDIEHVGVTTRAGWVTFGVSTWGPRAAPLLPSTVVVLIDTDGDDEANLRIAEMRVDGSDAFLTCVTDLADPDLVPHCVPSLLSRLPEEAGTLDSRLALLSVPLTMLGTDGPFRYHVATANAQEGDVLDDLGPFPYDPAAPGLRFDVGTPVGGGDAGLHADVAGELPFRIDRDRAEATGTRGALVLRPLAGHDQQVATVEIGEATPTPVPPYERPFAPPLPPFQPPFVPHDLRGPLPAAPRLPKHRRTATVAGARLTITGPRRCVKPNGTFTVELRGTRRSRSARFVRIVRTELRVDRGRTRTDRRAPFRQRVRVSRLQRGSLHRVTVRATLELRDGKRMRKSMTVRFRVCS